MSPSRRTTKRSSGVSRRSRRAKESPAIGSSSRCSTACARGCSVRSRPRGTRCSWHPRSAPTGTRISCAGSPSDRRTWASSSRTSFADELAARNRRCGRRRWRRHRDEHRVPPRGGRHGCLPARARSARERIHEPRRRGLSRPVLGSAQHRDRAAEHRGVHAVRRAARRRDRPPPGRVPLPPRSRRRRRGVRSRASRSRTSSASRAASSSQARSASCARSPASTACWRRPTARSTATRAPRPWRRGMQPERVATARPWSPAAR